MLVVFRVDASLALGAGHLARCITLANELEQRGAQVVFIGVCEFGSLRDKLVAGGHTYIKVRPATEAPAIQDPELLRAEFCKSDAAATAAAISSLMQIPDWLIVDHYSIDSSWCAELRSLVKRIMVIDDLANRSHDCDVLLDQNLVTHMEHRYDGKVPESCISLLGPEWSLLQPFYARERSNAPLRQGSVRRILVSFGGADSFNMTGRTVDALLSLDARVQIDLVVASEHRCISEIQDRIAGRSNFTLHVDVPSLASLMVRSDLAIGACGSSAWERLCVGLPSLVVTLAENQVPLAEELHARGLVRWLGDHSKVNSMELAAAINLLLTHDLDPAWSAACANTVDGRGVVRVGEVLMLEASSSLCARRAVAADEGILLHWANDPATRRNGFNPGRIDEGTHHRWLEKRLRDAEDCRLFVVETTRKVAVGQVRFERQDRCWEVHYSVAPQFRGRGIGAPMLQAAINSLRKETLSPIFGKVKAENQRSRRIFLSLGFEEEAVDQGAVIFRLHEDAQPIGIQ